MLKPRNAQHCLGIGKEEDVCASTALQISRESHVHTH